MKQFIFLILTSILILSCNSSLYEIDGIQSDTIQQSIKETYCNYKEQAISMFTIGDSWIISSIFVDGKPITIDSQKNLPYSIYGDWFTIIRTNKKKHYNKYN